MTEASRPVVAPRLAVVLCSLNGADGVARCLTSLRRQTIADQIEVVVVDDGSTDATSSVAARHGARVLRHEQNRGLAAARNTGISSVSAPVVAFLDDDCEAEPDWAANLLDAYEAAADGVMGIGGPVGVAAPTGYLRGYLIRHNPLLPLEMDLAESPGAAYRFWRYLVRNWHADPPVGRRAVFSLVGANMSFRTSEVTKLGFDESMTFGSEDLDLSIRIRKEWGDQALLFEPSVRVVHHFRPGLRDTLRRSHSYGRGHARMLRKYPTMRPTVFPLPILSVMLLVAGLRDRRALVAAAVMPHVIHPRGAGAALTGRPEAFFDAYVSGLQEASFLGGALLQLVRRRRYAQPPVTQDS